MTISYLIFSAGEVSFFIASHLKTSKKLAENLNDIKKLHVPDTCGWTFKLTDLDASINTLRALTVRPHLSQ